jgi:hypothetical protein
MTPKYFFFTFILIFCTLGSFAQDKTEKFTISGYVKEQATGEFIIGTNVYVKPSLQGTTTNQYGFYSLTLPKGKYTLVFSYIGYSEVVREIDLDKDLRINTSLQEAGITTDAVEIVGEKSDQNVSGTEMGTVKLEMETIKELPAFMGEVDILKTIQLLPGVKGAGEGNSGFYVRGGGPDQNLVLLDEAVVYNAAHLFGFFSVFNGDAVKDINLIKGGMPAEYGGRLASVLDIAMKEGNNRKYQVEGGIGLISSRLTVQGPIKKDTSSFIVSGRRTYIDVMMQPFIKKDSPFKGSGYYFYDLNTKINYRLSDKDRLFLSGYFGRDVFNYKNAESGFNVNIPWGNATTSLRWNHLFSSKLFMNVSAIFSDYNFSFGAEQQGFEFRLFSGITDYNAKVDFSFYPDVRHSVKFGTNYTYHTFTPTNASAKSGEVEFDFGPEKKEFAHEAAVYITDDFDLTEKIRLNAGLRYSYFMQVGKFDRYVENEFGRITDTIHYGPGEKVKSYGGLEPRFSIRYTLNKASSLKASYTRNLQYVHLASLSSVSLPTDIWVPSSDVVKPQVGVQYAAGYFRNFKDDTYESSVEVYYKSMENQVEYAEGALPEDGVNNNADNSFTFGTGQSYGAEFFFKKRTGKLTGWIGYTLSWTTRNFPGINNGETFYAKYDRRHDGSLVLTYDLTKQWTVSSIFVYGTGNAITLPVARYLFEGNIVNEYGARNSFRMAPYHRLDISATYVCKPKKKFQSSWNFSVFNVYNRHNPYFIYFDNEGDITQGNLKITAKQVSLFPIIPSVTWNFKF